MTGLKISVKAWKIAAICMGIASLITYSEGNGAACEGLALLTLALVILAIVNSRKLEREEERMEDYRMNEDMEYENDMSENRSSYTNAKTEVKRLYRSKSNRQICGVCAGIAEYFEVDPTLVRLITFALMAMAGSGLFAYIVAAIIIPEEN